MTLRVLGAPLHERADRRRRAVQDRHAVAGDDLPPAVLVRRAGRALVEHAGRAVGERPVDDVAVAGDPAGVGGAPVDVVVLQVEDPAVGGRHPGQVAAGRVEDPLGLPGRARGVEDVERVLGAHHLGLALGGLRGHELVVPDVAALDPADLVLGAPHHHAGVHAGAPSRAASTLAFRGTSLPPRQAPSPVIIAVTPQSSTRSRTESGEKPPKMTVWGAPIRAHASIATTISGTIPR